MFYVVLVVIIQVQITQSYMLTSYRRLLFIFGYSSFPFKNLVHNHDRDDVAKLAENKAKQHIPT